MTPPPVLWRIAVWLAAGSLIVWLLAQGVPM